MSKALLAEVLATNNFGDTRDTNGLAGPIAFLIILVLAAVTVFLVRNMNSRLRRLPDRFPSNGPSERPEGGPAAGESTTPVRENGNVG